MNIVVNAVYKINFEANLSVICLDMMKIPAERRGITYKKGERVSAITASIRI